MSTQQLSWDLLWTEITKIVNQKIEEMAQSQIEEQVKIFREKLMEQKAEVITKVLARVFGLYTTFWKEIIIKIPIPE